MRYFLRFLFLILLNVNWCFAQDLSFSDSAFFSALLNHQPAIDLNQDRIISQAEAIVVKQLFLSGKSISNVQELAYFSGLERLDLSHNQIDSIDLGQCPKISWLKLDHNKLQKLDLSGLPMLQFLSVNDNHIAHLHLDHNPMLDTLHCDHSHVHHLKLNNCHRLQYLSCAHNELDSLNLSDTPGLMYLDAHANIFKQIKGLEQLSQLQYADLEDGRLRELDVSACVNLKFLFAGTNPALIQICLNDAQLQISGQCSIDACFHKDSSAQWSNRCGRVTGRLRITSQKGKAYPNPSKGLVHFAEPIFQIRDLLGNEVFSNSSGVNKVELNQPAGYYYAITAEGEALPFVLNP